MLQSGDEGDDRPGSEPRRVQERRRDSYVRGGIEERMRMTERWQEMGGRSVSRARRKETSSELALF